MGASQGSGRRSQDSPAHERQSMAITEQEQQQIETANAAGETAVVFIHGLSLLPSSWDNSAGVFDSAGDPALPLDQFKYGWANALSDEEAKDLYERYHVAAPGVALMQMANANLNPFTEAKVDTKNPYRGPLLIIDGEKDHTVPWAIASASYN